MADTAFLTTTFPSSDSKIRDHIIYRRENRLRSYEKHHKYTLNLNLKDTAITI